MIILFDLDGTLIDSTDAILHCFRNSFKVAGLEKRGDEEIKSLIGYPLDIMYRELGVNEEKIWDMVALYKSCYRKISKEMTELLPNARVMVAGGREHIFDTEEKELQMFNAGADAIVIGNYLTTKGFAPELDRERLKRLGFKIAKSCNE